MRQRLRELRQAGGLTLRQVAERAHLDVSTLSRLESGKRRLAIDHLPPLADALGVSVDALLAAPGPPDPRVSSRPIRRHGMTMWPLNHPGSTNRLQAYRVHIPASNRHPPATRPVHDGHDWVYVLSGRLRLVLGSQELVVETGQAAEFATTTPHWFGATNGPVDIIVVFGAQGERAHLDEPASGQPVPERAAVSRRDTASHALEVRAPNGGARIEREPTP